MQRLTRRELEKLIALQSNKYRKDVTAILEAYYSIIKDAILLGYAIDVPGVGCYSNTQVAAKEERVGKLPGSNEECIYSAHDAYNKPIFRFKKTIREEMKDSTEGKVF